MICSRLLLRQSPPARSSREAERKQASRTRTMTTRHRRPDGCETTAGQCFSGVLVQWSTLPDATGPYRKTQNMCAPALHREAVPPPSKMVTHSRQDNAAGPRRRRAVVSRRSNESNGLRNDSPRVALAGEVRVKEGPHQSWKRQLQNLLMLIFTMRTQRSPIGRLDKNNVLRPNS